MLKKKILRKPPPAQHPTSAEREYFRLLMKYQKAFQRLLSDGLKEIIPDLKDRAANELPEIRQDSSKILPRISHFDANIEKTIRQLFESVQDSLMARFPDSILRRWAQAMVGNVNKVSKTNIKRTAKVADLEIEPLLKDKELNPYFENVVDENIGLIRSISEQRLPDLKNALVYGITQDLPHSEIAKIIQEKLKISKNSAALIARDQIGKLNGRLAQYRQEQLGGSRYKWRTAGDERVSGRPGGLYPKAKPSHWHREGKTYYWSAPPKGGHPGQRPRCRCYPEMILEDVIE